MKKPWGEKRKENDIFKSRGNEEMVEYIGCLPGFLRTQIWFLLSHIFPRAPPGVIPAESQQYPRVSLDVAPNKQKIKCSLLCSSLCSLLYIYPALVTIFFQLFLVFCSTYKDTYKICIFIHLVYIYIYV